MNTAGAVVLSSNRHLGGFAFLELTAIECQPVEEHQSGHAVTKRLTLEIAQSFQLFGKLAVLKFDRHTERSGWPRGDRVQPSQSPPTCAGQGRLHIATDPPSGPDRRVGRTAGPHVTIVQIPHRRSRLRQGPWRRKSVPNYLICRANLRVCSLPLQASSIVVQPS